MPGAGRDARGASFGRARVLVVEDEPFIALDLASAVKDADGVVVGPAATVREALDFVATGIVTAAIPDVDLPDGHVGPVLEALGANAVMIVVHTGVGLPPEVRARFPHVPVYAKPTPADVLARVLASGLRQ